MPLSSQHELDAKEKSPSYHWLLDLFKCLNLPVLDGVQEALHKSNERQMTALRNAQAKRYRLKHKNARLEEQEGCKRWVKQQSISHSYRECEDDLPDDGADALDDSGVATLVVTNSKCSKLAAPITTDQPISCVHSTRATHLLNK